MSKIVSPLPFIFGLKDKKISAVEIELFRQKPVYGFILFKRNIESYEQLKSLIHGLKTLYPDRDTPIFIDQEGGRVARLKPPIAKKEYRPVKVFGDLYDSNPEKAVIDTEQNYFELARELVELGISGPLAPVCDIRNAGAHDVIGDRSFGKEATKVIALADAAVRGIKKAGAVPCFKHIPGHGRAVVDSHFELPHVNASIDDLETTDFKVFFELSRLHPDSLAMTAHIIYTELDSEKPVTVSRKAIAYIRDIIGFKGILITDAIEMKALHSHVSKSIANKHTLDIGEKIDYKQTAEYKLLFTQSLCKVSKEALDAGCDYVLHCTGDIDEMTALCNSIIQA